MALQPEAILRAVERLPSASFHAEPAPELPDATDKLTVPEGQPLRLDGWLATVGVLPTVKDALATASVLGRLSTTALTLLAPVPALPLKVTVALPLDCMDDCAPDREPLDTLKLT